LRINPKPYYIFFLLALELFGCRHTDHSQPKPGAATTTPNTTIEMIDQEGIQQLTRQRNGKILLLNFWATWCQPCVDEFPDLVKISREFDRTKYEVVGISLDDPEDIQKVLSFIRKNNVPFKVQVASVDNTDAFINSLNESWNGAIPATFIYDTSGHLKYFSIGSKSFARFKEALVSVN
jgi:peroxiredoxin